MKRFTQLFCGLDQTTRTNEKVATLEKYFSEAPSADAAWALQFLSGKTLPRAVPTKSIWQWAADETGYPPWLIEECHDSVGDMAETIALLLPESGSGIDISLRDLIEQRLLPLRQLPEAARRNLLIQTWRELDAAERLVWNKLITGNFRVGVSRTLVIRALAEVAGIEPAVMAHRVMGAWKPTAEDFLKLLKKESSSYEPAKPYPFFLASPLELKIESEKHLADLGPVTEWLAEWKWDGIRAQLIRRGVETLMWSRGEEMVTDTFPEIIRAGNFLPNGTVIDGEIVAWKEDQPLSFSRLQRRLGRKNVSAKMRRDFPVTFVAYDVIEVDGNDFRSNPLQERRARLEKLISDTTEMAGKIIFNLDEDRLDTPMLPGMTNAPMAQTSFPIRLSPSIQAATWEQLGELQKQARTRGVEGVMLKHLDSAYGVGRQRGNWWKWKIAPFVIDAVLIAAQRGHGRRASLYTDYTFGVWKSGHLVPVAKAYSGLTDEEINQVDSFVRRHTLNKFGPVRSVTPQLVFELAFEGVQKSTRHKAGVAVRFPRMNRWRHDKKPEEADTLENLLALANLDSPV